MRLLKVFATFVLLVLALIVLFQNTDRVVFSVLFWRVEAPAMLMFAAMFLSGVAVGFAAPMLQRKLSATKPALK
jgi:uncharacterized integral membrane protein